MSRTHSLLLLALLVLSACADNRRILATELAGNARMSGEWIQAHDTHLMTWRRLERPGEDLTVFIEGDGFAYVTTYRISPDPTPRTPMVLQLAASHQGGNVAYLARPCMYFDPLHPYPECKKHLSWTLGRFSGEVVGAMDLALNALKQKSQAPRLHLVGFSGGGAIAALLAARREDIASLRTLAGNLDHELFTRTHKVAPLSQSLNPVHVASKLAHIPQIHFIGAQDTIVPETLARSFVKALGDERCVQIMTLPGVSHNQGWIESWPLLRLKQPQCLEPEQPAVRPPWPLASPGP